MVAPALGQPIRSGLLLPRLTVCLDRAKWGHCGLVAEQESSRGRVSFNRKVVGIQLFRRHGCHPIDAALGPAVTELHADRRGQRPDWCRLGGQCRRAFSLRRSMVEKQSPELSVP